VTNFEKGITYSFSYPFFNDISEIICLLIMIFFEGYTAITEHVKH